MDFHFQVPTQTGKEQKRHWQASTITYRESSTTFIERLLKTVLSNEIIQTWKKWIKWNHEKCKTPY